MINNGKSILADRYEKRHLASAQRRLTFAFLAGCIIATLFAVLAIQVCADSCMFIPA